MDSAEIVSSDSDIGAVLSGVPHDQWIQLPVSGFLQPARRNHSAEVVDGKLYVAGGSRNGRRLSDFQVKQGNKLNKLLIVAGHVKGSSESVTVWSIDCELNLCNIMKTHGKVPIARGGQSVTLVGRRLLMFGGEDTRRRLLNDHHILDLETVVGFNRNHEIEQPRIVQSPAAAASVTSAYALTTTGEKKSPMNLMEENTNEAQTESSPKVPIAGSDVLVVGKKTFESRFAEVREENLRLKRDLDEMNSSNLDLLKELQLVHVQLTTEISRCFKLEKKLEPLHSIEKEIQALRQQISMSEQDMDLACASAQQQNSVGV